MQEIGGIFCGWKMSSQFSKVEKILHSLTWCMGFGVEEVSAGLRLFKLES
jgi:hypothetical protein